MNRFTDRFTVIYTRWPLGSSISTVTLVLRATKLSPSSVPGLQMDVERSCARWECPGFATGARIIEGRGEYSCYFPYLTINFYFYWDSQYPVLSLLEVSSKLIQVFIGEYQSVLGALPL